MSTTPPAWFRDLGIPDACVAQKSSAEERGCSFSIKPQEGDQIWRVQVDDCWIKDSEGSSEKRVDYLFWCQSAAGSRVVLLVELKGKDLKSGLEQITRTLERLCKHADGNGIHTGKHQSSPGHDKHNSGGVRAYVILSKSKADVSKRQRESKGGIPQRQKERARIQKRYGVIVHTHNQRLVAERGIESLP